MALFAFAQETSGPAVDTYNAIADSILATKAAEKGIIHKRNAARRKSRLMKAAAKAQQSGK